MDKAAGADDAAVNTGASRRDKGSSEQRSRRYRCQAWVAAERSARLGTPEVGLQWARSRNTRGLSRAMASSARRVSLRAACADAIALRRRADGHRREVGSLRCL